MSLMDISRFGPEFKANDPDSTPPNKNRMLTSMPNSLNIRPRRFPQNSYRYRQGYQKYCPTGTAPPFFRRRKNRLPSQEIAKDRRCSSGRRNHPEILLMQFYRGGQKILIIRSRTTNDPIGRWPSHLSRRCSIPGGILF